MSIFIEKILEERDDRPFPDWITDPEDDRIFTGSVFGLRGQAWGTVISIYLADNSPKLPRFVEFFGQPRSSWPIAEVLQLRVCSPTFIENDKRFRTPHHTRCLIQETFDFQAAVEYCQEKIKASQRLKKRALIAAWEQDFFVFDPDNM